MPRMKNPKPGSLQKDPIYTSDNFRMYCFKIMPCSKHYSHDWTECPFAHPGEKATRRDPRLYTYVGIECPCVKGEAKNCPRGDNCPFAHNVFECWLHPSRYRTQMCNEPATCRRKICFFAHKMEEIRQPSPVSQDMDAGKPGPKRVSTSPEKRTMRSPPPEVRRQSCDGRLIAGQSLADYGNRGNTANELPPRPRMSVEATRPSTRSQPTVNPLTQQPPQFSSSVNQSSGLMDQLQTLAALCQQQQQRENFNSLDLAAAMEQMSLYANQPSMQTPTVCPSLETGNGGSSQTNHQINALLLALVQQQLQNNNSNPSLLPSLTGQQQFPAENLLMNNPNFSNPATSHLNSLSNNTLLLQQLQAAQSLGGMTGFRSSLDSTLSNGSGSRIPARVSYDGVMSPPISSTLQHLAELNTLNQQLSETQPSSAPDFILPGSQQRSSTESSYADSYGQWSIDASILDSLKASESISGLNKTDAMNADQLPVEDFISFNQGSETFASANTTTTTTSCSDSQQQQQQNSAHLSS